MVTRPEDFDITPAELLRAIPFAILLILLVGALVALTIVVGTTAS